MNYDFPEYLRLHVADDIDWGTDAETDFELDCLCQAFTMATGWHLDHHLQEVAVDAIWSTQIVDARGGEPITIELSEPILHPDDRSSTGLPSGAAAKSLAKELSRLVERLHRTERALWEREAELAAAVPFVTRPEDEPSRLAIRLESILQGAAEGVDGVAAALYLLDDGTSHLKLRSQWGLSVARFTDAPRPLRTAKGDLEALAGQAVVLEDAAALPHWNIPFSFPAAVCIPVSTATFPLGTLWIFADHKRDFSARETNILEIVAGRIAVELEREILLREHLSRQPANHLAEVVTWQNEWLPNVSPDLHGWDIAASPSYENSLNSELYQWSVDDLGKFHFSLCGAMGSGIAASLTAAQISGLLCQPASSADVDVALQRVNHLLWRGSTGDRLASAWTGLLDPATGRLNAQAAGDLFAFVIRPHGWESLARPSDALGSDEVIAISRIEQMLFPGDILMVLSGQRRNRPRHELDENSQATQYAEVLLRHNHLTAKDMSQLVRSCWVPQNSAWIAPPAVLIARYLD